MWPACAPAIRATVALIPEPSRRLNADAYKMGLTAAHRRFAIEGSRPGAYTAFAFEDFESEAWKDPRFLEPYESQERTVTARGRAVATVRLKAIPGPD